MFAHVRDVDLLKVYIKRVPTNLNIADLPSRPSAENSAFMCKVGATKLDPVLPER